MDLETKTVAAAAKPATSETTRLLLSIDYGTKTIATAFRFVTDNPAFVEIDIVSMTTKDEHAPQKIAWDADGNFYHGEKVIDALIRKKITYEDIIELWKLLLYKKHADTDCANEIKEKICGRTLEEVIGTHLRHIVADAKDFISTSQMFRHPALAAIVSTCPVDVRLSIPQMWKAPANVITIRAALHAGIDRVELVYEPQAAAAHYLHNTRGAMPAHLQVGDRIPVADIGGGTGDFVSYSVRHSSDHGAKMELEPVKETGDMCGSEYINVLLRAWLQADRDGFEKECNRLGISRDECLYKASERFESIKEGFRSFTTEDFTLTIRGNVSPPWNVEVSSELIRSFFDQVIGKITRCIDELLDNQTKIILIPGGFGRSQYLLNKLHSDYGHRVTIVGQANLQAGGYLAVARGALMRYDDIKLRGVPADQSFGIAMIEEWSHEYHPDATYFNGDRMRDGRVSRKDHRPNMDIVCKDQYRKDLLVVYERWFGLTKQGKLDGPDDRLQTEKWLEFNLAVDEREVKLQVYWAEIPLADHEPIRVGVDADSELRQGIEEWQLLSFELPNDLEALGLQAEESGKGHVYKMFWHLELVATGANIAVTWRFALPEYDKNGFFTPTRIIGTQQASYELSMASHNPFARTELNRMKTE